MWRAMTLRLLLILSLFLKVEVGNAYVAKPGCNSTCGNVSIPYPFGMGPDHCFHNPWFEIECKPSPYHKNASKPFLSKFHNVEVVHVLLLYSPYFLTGSSFEVVIPPLNACSADTQQQLKSIDLRGSPFHFSDQNEFVVEGCSGDALLVDQNNKVMAGCATVCDKDNYTTTTTEGNNCHGDNCCHTSIQVYSDNMQFYQINFSRATTSGEGQSCLVASLVDYDEMYELDFLQRRGAFILLQLTLGREILDGRSPYSTCQDDSNDATSLTSICTCRDGYYGNPYFTNGCQVPRECMSCPGYCRGGEWDLEGNLISDSNDINCYELPRKPILNLASILGLSISFGVVVIVIVLYGMYRFGKRWADMKRRARFFKHNGGLLLQQQLSSNEGVVERTRIFSMNELDKATDHFNENRILGQGGQGTVYKGMLTDGSIVAIKKAKLLDQSQLEQFINEVVILSQINHRNVVKLLGCCLETEVPLLVYEFIPNGTLFKHIHYPDEEFVVSWDMCLKIAADSATAIWYLHSSSSTPIYHRDIKSSNILLDEKHRAKVSDFGSSKTIAIDQTHLTTLVQGTMGYLDPEYFQSYQFTEKSDVYSFGVVLLELLTRKRPIYRDVNTMEQKNMVTEFLFLMENSRLSENLDPINVREAKEDELLAMAELVKRCLCWSGKLRPTMKEVAMTLEMIMKSPTQVTGWLQEQEPFPIHVEGFDEYSIDDINVA